MFEEFIECALKLPQSDMLVAGNMLPRTQILPDWAGQYVVTIFRDRCRSLRSVPRWPECYLGSLGRIARSADMESVDNEDGDHGQSVGVQMA